MKGNNKSNVSVGKPKAGGAFYAAKITSDMVIPKDATTALPEEFKCLGYLSEDGFTNTIARESEELAAWGGDVVSNPQTKYSEQYKQTMIEQRVEVFGQVFGESNVSVTLDGQIRVAHSSKELEHYAYVYETLLGANRVERSIIPDGKVIEMGDIVRNGKEPVGYETTIQAYPDETGESSHSYIAEILPDSTPETEPKGE